jgi:SAM-dependent methyltransferase
MTTTRTDQEARPVSFDQVLGSALRLHVAATTFAALGARLRLAAEPDLDGDPAVVAALDAVLEAAGIPPVGDLPPEQGAQAAAMLRSLFRQTADIIEDPGRAPGWRYTDPLILQGQGRASMLIPTLIAACSPAVGPVSSFLDVGTGVGWLAVAATTQVWPGCEVVGIDVWEPSLALAAANVASAGVGDRVTIRRQDLAELDDRDRFDCAWVPSFFFSAPALARGIPRVVESLRPGGWVVVGRFDPPPDPVARATSALGVVRDGGAALSDDEVLAMLRDAGCVEAARLDHGRPVPMGLFGGRRGRPAP